VTVLHLPSGHGAVEVHNAVIDAIGRLPRQLRNTVTWDQGWEMSHHAKITLATDLKIYFCDPHSPWQRPVNENTVSVVGGRLGWPSGWCRQLGVTPENTGRPVGVPCVGPVPRVAGTDLNHSSWLDQELVRLRA
jgi:hypothetical protein